MVLAARAIVVNQISTTLGGPCNQAAISEVASSASSLAFESLTAVHAFVRQRYVGMWATFTRAWARGDYCSFLDEREVVRDDARSAARSTDIHHALGHREMATRTPLLLCLVGLAAFRRRLFIDRAAILELIGKWFSDETSRTADDDFYSLFWLGQMARGSLTAELISVCQKVFNFVAAPIFGYVI